MTYDAVSQWDQIVTFNFTDWYPAINAILMWMLTRFWYSPAPISLLQIIIASLVIGYGLNSLRNVSQLPGYILIAIGFLISANPLVGVINITLLKDVIYGFFVLLLTIYLFNVVSSDGEWIIKPTHFILLGVTLAIIWLFRFNGFPIVLVSLITSAIIYKKHLKQFAFSALVAFTIILFVLGPLYSWFSVNKAFKKTYGMEFKQSYGIALIHPVVAYMSSNNNRADLSDEEKQYLNSIYPLNKTWPYSCYDATVFLYQSNFMSVMKDPRLMLKIFFKFATRDPKVMINHYLCLSSFIWQPNQPKNVYLETLVFDDFDFRQTPSWIDYREAVKQRSFLPEVRGLIVKIIEAEWHRDIYTILWRPAIYMYLFLASLAFFVYRTRRKKWLLLSVPLITQSIVIMFTAQLQALRYQYPVYLISMLFTVPLFILGFKTQLIQQKIALQSGEE
jgi:hypothetical protein